MSQTSIKLRPLWSLVCSIDHACPNLSIHAALVFMRGRSKIASAMWWWLSQGLSCDPGSPAMCSSRSQNSTNTGCQTTCMVYLGWTMARPPPGCLGKGEWLQHQPPANARYVISPQLLQYLPLPISNTLWTSRMACCEQTCLLSAQEFPGFALRQARRFSPGETETCCSGEIVQGFQRFVVHCKWHLPLLILLNSCTGSFH